MTEIAATSRPSTRQRWLVAGGLLALFAIILVRTAWMSDDAYITLRTVDNWVNGYGLTWNVQERVQSYTHPLWMFVLSVAYFITREAYFTTIALSILIALAALLLVVTRIAITPLAAVAGALMLMLSKAFVDFSTSGLENALTSLVLGIFFAIYFAPVKDRRRFATLTLVAALLVVNRLDALLLVLPPLMLVFWNERRLLRANPWRSLGLVLLALTPLLAWEIFSLVYYGTLTPNTSYAKLNTGIPLTDLLRQGAHYFAQSTRIDFFTSLMMALAAAAVLWKGKSHTRVVIVGALLYLLYVLRVGGDFMSGRFLTAPLYCVVAALVASEWPWLQARRVALGSLAGVLLLGLIAPYSPVRGDAFYPCGQGSSKTAGVDDERGCYFDGTGLLRQERGQPIYPRHNWMAEGLASRDDPLRVQIVGAVGMYAYAAGPGLHVVDLSALADPLLARLQLPAGSPWRIGHFVRLIPAGYLETLMTGELKICNPGLSEYYRVLTEIISEPVFSAERFALIAKMNTGQYDALLAGYGNPDPIDAQLCNASVTTDIEFMGGPTLVGYSVDNSNPVPGSLLSVMLYWRDGDAHQNALASFVHVRPIGPEQLANPRSPSGMWAQAEHYQPGGQWTDKFTKGHVYADQFLLDIPADMPPGVYNLEVGWFDPQKGEQLEPRPETVTPPHTILWRSVLLPPVTVQ